MLSKTFPSSLSLVTLQHRDALTLELEQRMMTTVDVVLLAALRDPRFRDLIPLIKNDTGALFTRRRVRDMLWGYVDPTLLNNAFPGIQPNDTSLDEALAQHSPTRMYTGAHVPGQTMEYVEWDGHNNLVCCQGGILGEHGVEEDATCAPAFGGASSPQRDASRIRGVFGTAVHPFFSPEETFHIATYPFGIYRHWPMQCAPGGSGPPAALNDGSDLTASIGGCDSYNQKGVSLLKFSMPTWALGNASQSLDEAQGYGISGPSGVYGVSQCVTQAPIFISRPNFLYASNSLRDALDADFPAAVPALHETFVGMEPITGQILEFHFRLGVNVRVEPITVHTLGLPVTYFEYVAPAYIPLGWGKQESLMSDSQAQAFLTQVYTPLKACVGSRWVGLALISLGGCLVLWDLAMWARKPQEGGVPDLLASEDDDSQDLNQTLLQGTEQKSNVRALYTASLN
jgi:hypothetical protein